MNCLALQEVLVVFIRMSITFSFCNRNVKFPFNSTVSIVQLNQFGIKYVTEAMVELGCNPCFYHDTTFQAGKLPISGTRFEKFVSFATQLSYT